MQRAAHQCAIPALAANMSLVHSFVRDQYPDPKFAA